MQVKNLAMVSNKFLSLWSFAKQKLPMALTYFGSTASLVVSSGAQLLTFAILARHLGVEQFGLLMTITAATSLGVQLCGLGASETLVRRVANDPAIYRAALGHNLILIGASGSVLILIFTAIMPRLVSVSSDSFTNLVALVSIVFTNVVLVRWILLTEQIFIARFQYDMANVANVGFAVARTLNAVVACYVFGVHKLSNWALWHFGGHVVVALICVRILSRFGAPEWRLLKNETRLGIYFCTTYFFQAVRQNVDLLVLGLVATPEIVGSFSVARRILDTSALTVAALHRLTYPKLAVASAAGFTNTLALAKMLLPLVIAISSLTSIAIFLGAPILPLLFGKDFSATIDYARAICWVGILFGAQEMAAEALGASGRHGIRAAIYNAGSIVGALLVAVLTYLFIINGTVFAYYAAETLTAVTFWIVMLSMSSRYSSMSLVSQEPSQSRAD
jgi:O-antigen/teichoic acid export membrane protein